MRHGDARYGAEIVYSLEDEGYIARVREMPWVTAYGSTMAEAASGLRRALEASLTAHANAGSPVPEPRFMVQGEWPA